MIAVGFEFLTKSYMPLEQVSGGHELLEESVTMLRTIFPYGHDCIPNYNLTSSMIRELAGLSGTGLVASRRTSVTTVWYLTEEGRKFLEN